MKKNLTELVFILDKSGSMGRLVDSVVGGFNELLSKQKSIEGDALVSIVLFDDKYLLLKDRVELSKIQDLTKEDYRPSGLTAMNDAIGKTLSDIGAKLSGTDEKDRPEKVIVAIMTDGQENASKEYNMKQIKEMIEHQQEKYSWEFIFMGANIDAMQASVNIGIDTKNTIQFDASREGVMYCMRSLSGRIAPKVKGKNEEEIV